MAKQCRSSILIEDSLGLFFECRCTLERRHEGNVHSDGKLSWLSEPVSSAAQFLKVLQTEIVLLEQLVGDVQPKSPPVEIVGQQATFFEGLETGEWLRRYGHLL